MNNTKTLKLGLKDRKEIITLENFQHIYTGAQNHGIRQNINSFIFPKSTVLNFRCECSNFIVNSDDILFVSCSDEDLEVITYI